jgi:biopolymer transport protein ExbB/TolQ
MGEILLILLVVLILILFLLLLLLQKKEKQRKIEHMQIEKLQLQIQESQKKIENLEQICDKIEDFVNVIDLYAALSKEEAKSRSLKENQTEILQMTEEIFQLLRK